MLGNLFRVNSNTPRVKETVGFNPANVKFIEGNGVTYGLSYEDNGNGTSKVKLLISPSYQSKTHEWNTDISISNEFKDQLSFTLIGDSAEIDRMGIIFPEEGINKQGKKYIKGLSFGVYEIKQLESTPSIKYLGTTRLQKHIKNDSPINVGNSYSQPKVVKISNDQVLVTANNLEDKTAVAWLLKSDKNEKFKALAGKKGFTERKLLKLNDLRSQPILNENTLILPQVSKKIVENQERKTTEIVEFDMAGVVKDLQKGKGIEEYLLGNKKGQIDKSPFFSSENEISLLQYVIEQDKDNDVVALLEKDQSSNTQELRLVGFRSGEPSPSFPIYRFEDSIEQLYVKGYDQDGFIVTAISGDSVITFNEKSFEESPKVTIIPVSEIKTLSDFVGIINGQLPPSIASSTTIVPTITSTAKASSASIVTDESTTKEVVLTTYASTIGTTQLSTKIPIATESTTQNPTTTSSSTVGQSTVTNATEISTISASVPTTTNAGKTTEQVFTTTVPTVNPTTAETSTARSTTVAVTTKAETTITPQVTTDATSTKRATVSTSVPTTISDQPTQTVFTIPSTRGVSTKKPSTPMVITTPLLPTPTSSPQSQLSIAGESNNTGIIVGSLLGVIGVVGLIAFGAYKCVQRHRRNNAAPIFHLDDSIECGEGSHDNSEIDTTSHDIPLTESVLVMNPLENGGVSETSLDHVSATLGTSRSSSPSPEGSRSSSPSF